MKAFNYHIRAWWPFWSCDLDHSIYESLFLFQQAPQKLALIGQLDLEMLENDVYINVHGTALGTDNSLDQKCYIYIHLVSICHLSQVISH